MKNMVRYAQLLARKSPLIQWFESFHCYHQQQNTELIIKKRLYGIKGIAYEKIKTKVERVTTKRQKFFEVGFFNQNFER